MVHSKSRSRRDESDDDDTPPPSTTKGKSKSKAKEPPPEEDQDMNNEEDEEEEEYEVEKIVKARKRNGSYEYFVKWKGYETDDNTWVMESDMAADELLAEYKRRNPETFAPKPRKSTSAVPKKPIVRQESSSDSEDERDRERERKARKSNATATAGGGGRASTSGKLESSSFTNRSSTKHKRDSSAMDEDEVEEISSSKQHKSSSSNKKSKTDSSKDKEKEALDFDGTVVRLDEESNLPVEDPKWVKRMMEMRSWEKVIAQIETVESRDKDKLVYFRTRNDERGIAFSSELKARCPVLLVDFYESHLRWRETKEGEEGNNE